MKLISFALLVLISLSPEAQVSIEPANPIEGQPVYLLYSGCEPPFPHIDSGEFFYTNQIGNQIEFVGFFSLSFPTCPIMYERTYNLGVYEEGDYEVKAYLVPADFPLPIDVSLFVLIDTLNFGVMAPVQIPIYSWQGIFISIILILIVSYLQRRAIA